jgi:hypothetical protein
MVIVKYDKESGAYVDSKRTHYVKASQVRGRLSAAMVEGYWLDKFKEAVKYEL